MITFKYIQLSYTRILVELLKHLPLERWHIKPQGVELTSHKTKYGMATSKGQVLINQSFIDTSAYQLLESTIRHEFAHLAVGLHQHHNRYFKRMAILFGVKEKTALRDEIAQIESNIDYKYILNAYLVDGQVRVIGGVHRKTKKYTDYPLGKKLTISIDGIDVAKFEYTEVA